MQNSKGLPMDTMNYPLSSGKNSTRFSSYQANGLKTIVSGQSLPMLI